MANLGFRLVRSAMLGGISASALLASSGAFAQDAAPAADDQASSNDIIVTTRRFEERLQDVPISVTAITAQELERQGIE